MRPELNQRFCGRCGEPCRGYEEPAFELDPPRRCAECAVDRRTIARIIKRGVAVMVAVPFALSVLGVLLLAIEFSASTRWNVQQRLWVLFWTAGIALLLGWFTAHTMRRAREESLWADSVRRRDRRPASLTR